MIYPSFLTGFAILAGACALSAGANVLPIKAETKAVKFVAVGDMPYSNHEAQFLRTELKAAIAKADVPFVIHYGDFKAGNDSCTDESFIQAQQDIYGLHPRVFYTPGDNEWTDCDRTGLASPQSELERLDTLRSLFFPQTANDSVQRQPNYPENARWWQDEVLFSTLHIVGTNNGRTQILKDEALAAIAQVEARDEANLEWLEQAFSEAKSNKAQALVLVMQADISKVEHDQPCSAEVKTNCDPYLDFRNQLTEAASQFTDANQIMKPVLLVHGDTFPFCWDKTFGGEIAPNLWRLNAWGDFQQPSDVTAIAFRPDQPQEPFEAKTLVNQVAPGLCAAD